MKTIGVFTVLALAFAGCSPGIISSSVVKETIGEASWHLTTDANKGLIDAAHIAFGAYPNPRGVDWMDVWVADDGSVCAHDGADSWCGGPLQGIPYVTVLRLQDEGYCVRVVDIFGNEVRSGCSQQAPPEEITDKVNGQNDQNGQNDKYVATASKDDMLLGMTLVINAVNDSLAKIGLSTRVAMPGPDQGLSDFDDGDIRLGEGSCKDVLEYLDDEFSDDHPGTDDYIFSDEAIAECLDDGRCRVGQIVTRAMAEACLSLPQETAYDMAEAGIITAGGYSSEALCYGENSEIPDCVGSPLVLDLDGDGLQLQGLAGGVSFPLVSGRPMHVGWLAGSDDALLALDLNGDGEITSGRELFGEATGGWAPDGFAALARHDHNGDGVISPSDPVFEKLLAWRDDGDGRSTSEELVPLSSVGIRQISLRRDRLAGEDAFGNQLGLLGAATGEQNERVPLFDVWFRMETETSR